MNTQSEPPVAPGMETADDIGRQLRRARNIEMFSEPKPRSLTPEQQAEHLANAKYSEEINNFIDGAGWVFWVLVVAVPAVAYFLKWVLDHVASLVRTIFG